MANRCLGTRDGIFGIGVAGERALHTVVDQSKSSCGGY